MTTITSPAVRDFGLPPADATMLTPFSLTASSYPRIGESGVTHLTRLEPTGARGTTIVNSTLLRDARGVLVAWVRHYPIGWHNGNLGKDKGDFSIYVDPTKWRRGYGTTVLRAAHQQWHLDFLSQHYTPAGRALVLGFLNQELSPQWSGDLGGECTSKKSET